MVKKRCNFTITNETKSRLENLSKESYKYWGKFRSQSEVIDVLVRSAFADKRKLMMEELKKHQKIVGQLSEDLDNFEKKRAEEDF